MARRADAISLVDWCGVGHAVDLCDLYAPGRRCGLKRIYDWIWR